MEQRFPAVGQLRDDARRSLQQTRPFLASISLRNVLFKNFFVRRTKKRSTGGKKIQVTGLLRCKIAQLHREREREKAVQRPHSFKSYATPPVLCPPTQSSLAAWREGEENRTQTFCKTKAIQRGPLDYPTHPLYKNRNSPSRCFFVLAKGPFLAFLKGQPKTLQVCNALRCARTHTHTHTQVCTCALSCPA